MKEQESSSLLSRRSHLKNIIRFNKDLIEGYKEQKGNTGETKRKRWFNNEIDRLKEENKKLQSQVS